MTSVPGGDTTSTAIRGACPSVHDPFAEADGALARIRLPGGVISTAGARAVAATVDAAGGTTIELTNRANLQLRGLAAASTARVRDLLVAAGVVDPDPAVDERRNVLSSPTAGIDPAELVDPRPVVASVLGRLGSAAARTLSPKFGILVDGGGAVHVRGRAHDLALGAVRDSSDRVGFEVNLGGALDEPARDAGAPRRVVEPAAVGALVDAVVELTAGHGRVRALVETAGEATVWSELEGRVGAALASTTRALVPAHRRSESPVGTRRQRQPGLVCVGAIVPLGRIDPATLHAVARLADAFAVGELRVSPWRQLLVPGVPVEDGPRVAAGLVELGLVVDPSHPAGAVVACAGARGCASGHTDTLADAAALIAELAPVPVASRPASIHVSGCEKGCASPGRDDVTLVGTAGGTYDLHRRDAGPFPSDPTGRRFGRRVRTTLEPADARCAAVRVGRTGSSPPGAGGGRP